MCLSVLTDANTCIIHTLWYQLAFYFTYSTVSKLKSFVLFHINCSLPSTKGSEWSRTLCSTKLTFLNGLIILHHMYMYCSLPLLSK